MKVGVLETRHPCHAGDVLDRYKAIVDGGDAWREQYTTWLPQNTNEAADLYAERLTRAGYKNYAGGICGVMSGYLFSEEPKVDGVEGDFWKGLSEDTDRAGTPWSDWWRERHGDALWGRDAWIWVNAPAKPADVEFASRADEIAAGMDRQYLVHLTARDVLDWGEDDKGVPTWIMFRGCESVREGIESGRIDRYTWTYIDATKIRRWTWQDPEGKTRAPTAEDIATEQPQIEHGMGEFPVVRLRLPDYLWALKLMHDPVLGHFRSDNDLEWALHRAAHAMPVLTRRHPDKATPTVGFGYFYNLQRDADGEDSVTYAEPEGKSFDLIASERDARRQEIYRVVNQMAASVDSDSAANDTSGASKELDWRAMDIVTSAYAAVVRQAMTLTSRLIARIRGEDDAKIEVSGLDGFQTELLSDWLADAALCTDASAMSETFKKEVASRQVDRLLGDGLTEERRKAIQDEIEAYETPDPIEDAAMLGHAKLTGTVPKRGGPVKESDGKPPEA